MFKTKISNFKIFIFFLVLSILGFLVIPKLNIRLNPSLSGANIYITYSLPNASPQVVDKKISSIIEEKISLLQGIEKIESNSFLNHGYLNVALDKYADIDKLRLEIATSIRQIKNLLPENASYPQVSLHNPNDESKTAFLIYQVNSNKKSFEIKKVIDRFLIPPISSLPQVDKVSINGYTPMEYVIKYDKKLLERYNISTQEIISSLQNFFEKKSLGKIQFNRQFITAIINNGSKINWKIPITKKNARIVYLTDISKINYQEKPTTAYYRINGKTSLSLSIFPIKSANTIVLRKQIEKIINRQKNLLPSDIQLIKTYDSTEYLRNELNKIYNRSFWVIVILLLFVILVYRSFRYFIIIVLALLANLGLSFLLYYLFDIQIQLYSLAGITISFGLVIDNSIVMIDHLKKYYNFKVFLPILASTLTTIVALIVIFFLKDEIKNNLIDFAYVIIINLFVSLIVALFLIPALVQKIHFSITTTKKQIENSFFNRFYYHFIRFSLRYKKLWLAFIILLFGLPVFMLPQKIDKQNLFAQAYNSTLGNEWYLDNIRPYVDKYLGGSLRLFSHYVFESAYYRKNEETKLMVIAQMPRAANLDQMNEVFLQLDNYLQQFNQIKVFKTSVYQSGYGEIEIIFNEKDADFAYVLKNMLIKKALDWGGIRWNIYGVGQGFDNGSVGGNNYNFQIVSSGYNYEHLNKWVDSLNNNLYKHPRINKIMISSDKYPYKRETAINKIRFNSDKLASIGIYPYNIWSELNDLTLKISPQFYISSNEKYMPVRLQSLQSSAFDVWKLLNYPLKIKDNYIKLGEITNISLEKTPLKIYKENQEYIKYINVQYTGANKFGKKIIRNKIDSLKTKLPLGIKFKLQERNYYFSADSQQYYYLLFLIIILIFGISTVFFESFKQAFLVISIIPISFIGIFLIFYLFDFNFDQGGIAGFILVSGLTVNAIFYILNDYKILLKTHNTKNSIELFIKAFSNKIFPISLTIISTILGFIPFIIGGQNEVFWFALAIATIGGLVFSFVGILVYLPLLSLKLKS